MVARKNVLTYRLVLFVVVTSLLGLHLSTEIPFFTSRSRSLGGKTSPKMAAELARNRKYFSNYRFLSFGTSRSWGSGLDNRTRDAFPFLLSETVDNLAIRASSPEYPSLCLSTLLGDKRYDVITLEYNLIGDDLRFLARRLRKRFPKAIMIFIYVWSPFQFILLPQHVSIRHLIRYEKGFSAEGDHIEVVRNILNRTKPEMWKFWDDPQSDAAIQEIVKEVGGYLISYSKPTPEESHNEMLDKFRLFRFDSVHFSEHGHQWVASTIFRILAAVGATIDRAVSPWEGLDSCTSWFKSGDTNLKHHPRMPMTQFSPPAEKYALEAIPQPSWIDVVNPLEKQARVFLSYMATGPLKLYPDVKVRVHSSTGNSSEATLVPLKEMHGQPYQVHVTQEAYVGNVEPGEHRLTVETLEDKDRPFRIVGIIVTPMEDKQ